jgi:hypothetical protein
MCDFCEKDERLDTEWHCLTVKIEGTRLSIDYDAYSSDSSFITDVPINYCPMCGKELNPKDENHG